MVRSAVVPETTSSVKELDDFKNRKRKNSEAKYCIDGHWCNEVTLTMTGERMEELGTADDKELDCCTNALKSSNHHEH